MAYLSVQFYCRPSKVRKDGTAPIEVSVCLEGRAMIVTDMRYDPQKFKVEFIRRNGKIWIYCEGIRRKIEDIYYKLKVNGELATPEIIKDIYLNGERKTSYTLAGLYQDFYNTRKKGVEAQTMRKYAIAWHEFLEYNRLSIKEEAKSVKPVHIQKYYNHIEGKYEPETWSKRMKNIKAIFAFGFQNGTIPSTPFAGFKMSVPKKDAVYLTQDEIDRIRKATLINDRLDRVRDLFLFQAFTGLSYGDLVYLKKEDFKYDDDRGLWYIKKNREKTGVEFFSVLFEDAIEIAKFYDYKLPVISNQKYNSYLAEIGSIAGISKAFTSHTARHTYAIYLLSVKHLPIEVVSKCLGHTSIKMTQHYAKMLDENILDVVNSLR